jgi:hypothetical protein
MARDPCQRTIADRLTTEFTGCGLADENGARRFGALDGGRIDTITVSCLVALGFTAAVTTAGAARSTIWRRFRCSH